MASSIQLLRSTVSQERPFPSNLLEGQPAININSNEPGLFFKTSNGELVKIGPAAVTEDGSPPNSSPSGSSGNSKGELWLDKSQTPPVLKVYDGTAWIDAGSGGGGGVTGSFVRWIYTAIGGETSLSGTSGGTVLEYTPGLEEVFVNGVLITRNVDYSANNGSSITNLAPLVAGDVVTVTSIVPASVISLPGVATVLRWSILSTAGQTVLSGSDPAGEILTYTAGLEEVYVNGAFLRRGVDYTATNGTSITLSAPLQLDDEVSVLAWSPFSVTGDIPASQIIFTTADSTFRTAQAKLGDLVSVKDFGAKGDNVNDDRFALNDLQASSVPYFFFPSGTYYLGGDYTFLKPVILMPGAVLRGVSNLRFYDIIEAGRYRIFDVGGTVTISTEGKQSVGYPEWWGARINSNAAGVASTNAAAINACIIACAETVFAPGDYFISSPIRITTSFRTLRGPNRGPVGGNRLGITRIILTSGSATVIEIETAGLPPVGNPWVQEITVENICVHRSIAPICPAPGSEANGPKGISVRNTIWVYLRNVQVSEHYIGVYIQNTIRTRLWEVVSFRSAVGNTSAGPDKFFGFFQNGFGGSFAGGNASTYYQECTAGQGANPFNRSEMVGFFMNGANSDTYMLRCETTAVGTGVLIDGAGVTGSQLRSGYVDIFLTEFVIDQFSEAGIKILNTSEWTAIAVNSGYSAPAGTTFAPAPSAGLHIENCKGLISCSNYQNIAWPSPTCRGLYIKDSTGVRSVGGMWVESQRPIELDNAKSCTIEDGVKNVDVSTTQAAVLLTNSSKNYVKSTVYSNNTRYVRGIDVPSGSLYNEINLTGFDSAAMIGGLSSVVRINGSSVTTPGTYNTNLASGIIA